MIDIEDEIRGISLPPLSPPCVEEIISQGYRRRRRLRGRRLALGAATVAIGVTLATAAFSSPDAPVVGAPPAVDSPIFAGLDRNLVAEVLNNPAAQANADINNVTDRDAMWQGMVMNFSLCREMFATDQDWHRAGVAPPVPALPPFPSHPVSTATTADIRTAYGMFANTVASSDRNGLDDLLTNLSGCGMWVPATPGDVHGPTIRDVIEGSN
jgi:hypothetical protein